MISVTMILIIGKDLKDTAHIIKKLQIIITIFSYHLMQLKIIHQEQKKLKKYLKIIFGLLVYL